jgi:hypothetical protein
MTWRNRPRVPVSCRDLDLAVVRKTLIAERGDVSAAAKALGVSSSDLRKLALSSRALNDVLTEALERAIDEAWATIVKGLEDESMRRRNRAAGLVLRYGRRWFAWRFEGDAGRL